MEILKVSATSQPKSVAGAMAAVLRRKRGRGSPGRGRRSREPGGQVDRNREGVRRPQRDRHGLHSRFCKNRDRRGGADRDQVPAGGPLGLHPGKRRHLGGSPSARSEAAFFCGTDEITPLSGKIHVTNSKFAGGQNGWKTSRRLVA